MNVSERNQMIREFFENRCMSILDGKGKASAGGSEDANQNFKQGMLKDGENIICDDIYRFQPETKYDTIYFDILPTSPKSLLNYYRENHLYSDGYCKQFEYI